MKKNKEPSIFQQEMKRDFETFKRLKGTKKLQFLWDYYKLPFVLGMTLLIVVLTFAKLLWEGQRPRRLEACVVLNTDDDCTLWFDEFTKELKKDGKSGLVNINQDQPFDYDNKYYYVQEIEVMTTVSSGRMDVAICGPDMYSYLLALNACLDLKTGLPEDLYQELSEKGMIDHNTANLTIDENGEVNPDDGIEGDFAVNLEGTAFELQYNAPQGNLVVNNGQTETVTEDEPLYVVIIRNTEHMEDSLALLTALTNQK